MGGLEFRILGPLEIWRDRERVPLEAARERAVLAVLLLQPNRVVAADRLTELIWGDDPPPRVRNTVHTLVWRLRRRLEAAGAPGVLVTQPPGYLIKIDPDQLDLHRFEELCQLGRQAMAGGRVADAERLLGEARRLWRGPPLEDVAADELRRIEVPRLYELHLQAVEEHTEAQLALGRHAELIGELRGLVADNRLREGLTGQLMLALYRSGRQAEALETYRTLRAVLARELAVEPGPAAQRLHQAVLRGDPTLDLPVPEPAAAPAEPAAPAGHPAPAMLPADVPAFTGRIGQMRELDALVGGAGTPTAVVISAIAGSAGVGKTALAVRWAHRMRDRFPGGQLYVNLRGYAAAEPLRPIEALSRFLRALGVPADQVPVEVDEAADLYRTLLADQRMLILLDNAASPDQVRPLLPGGRGCLVLVTSRDRLSGLVAHEGAHRVTLDVLTAAEAQTLLARLLGTERVTAELEGATELARACAHLPLALRIAAANLGNHPHQSIVGYVGELRGDNRLASLEVDGDEQAAVRATFALSYTRLPDAARRLFRLLGLVPGPDFSAEAAAAVAGTPVREARRGLDRLAGAHLISESAPGRYAFHDLLRLYAAELAEREECEAERRAAVDRVYDWYVHTTDAAATLLFPQLLRLPFPPPANPDTVTRFTDHAQALSWLDAERPCLLAATAHAARHGPYPAAWLLADAARGYFLARMYTVDWLALAHAGRTAARAEGDRYGEAAAELSLGGVHMRLSRHPAAIAHYSKAIDLAEQVGWLEGQAATLGNLGSVHQHEGRLDEAAQYYERGLALHRQTGRVAGQASGLGNLGTVYRQMGQLARAAEQHAEALELFRSVGARMGEAIDLGNLGETYHDLGRLDVALEHHSQALALHRELGNRGNQADALRCLAAIHRDRGDLPLALRLAEEGLEVARDTDDRQIEADVLNVLATVQLRLDRADLAVRRHEQALDLARETGNTYTEAEALIGLATAHGAVDRSGSARPAPRRDPGWSAEGPHTCARQALAVTRRVGYRMLEGQALTSLAAAYLARGEPERAVAPARQALDIHRETGHRPGEARCLVELGRALEATGDPAAAVTHWHAALALFTDIGTPEVETVRALLAEARRHGVGPVPRRGR